MHASATVLPSYAQQVVEILLEQGVVCQTTTTGEPIFELYSLLDALLPQELALAAQLQQVLLIPRRLEALDTYLLYVSLPDLLTHLLPISTLAALEDL
jgi:hypothetical protein